MRSASFDGHTLSPKWRPFIPRCRAPAARVRPGRTPRPSGWVRTMCTVTGTGDATKRALQFVPTLRRGRSRWHRIAGRVLVPAGVFVALSGLRRHFASHGAWMTRAYALALGAGAHVL